MDGIGSVGQSMHDYLVGLSEALDAGWSRQLQEEWDRSGGLVELEEERSTISGRCGSPAMGN